MLIKFFGWIVDTALTTVYQVYYPLPLLFANIYHEETLRTGGHIAYSLQWCHHMVRMYNLNRYHLGDVLADTPLADQSPSHLLCVLFGKSHADSGYPGN